MDWKQFIVGSFEALAWPLVILSVVYILKDKVGEMLLNLKTIKHKDTEIEFTNAVNELALEDISSSGTGADTSDGDVGNVIEGSKTRMTARFHQLLDLSKISSRSAVMEAWLEVEGASARAAVRSGYDVSKPGPTGLFLLREISSKLDPQSRHQLDELRKLRNMAVHSEDFDLRGMPIEAYIDLSLALANKLDEFFPAVGSEGETAN